MYPGLDQSRAEAVSARALDIGAFTHRSIASIVAHGLDRTRPAKTAVGEHANVRGREYFH